MWLKIPVSILFGAGLLSVTCLPPLLLSTMMVSLRFGHEHAVSTSVSSSRDDSKDEDDDFSALESSSSLISPASTLTFLFSCCSFSSCSLSSPSSARGLFPSLCSSSLSSFSSCHKHSKRFNYACAGKYFFYPIKEYVKLLGGSTSK